MTNKEKLGKIGETLVSKLLNATLSENKYDTVKDMVELDGTNVEVKTQNRHPRGFFTINVEHKTNMNKCLTVDRLIFVEYDSTNTIKIFECTDRSYEFIQTKPTLREPMGRIMAGFPISKMTLLKSIDDSNLASEMRSLSGSKFFGSNSQYSVAY